MNTPKFTPGPWTISRELSELSVGPPHEDVCVLLVEDREIPWADAHLIAAAPDLYAALVQARRALEVATTPLGRDRAEVLAAQRAADSALTKARGES